MVRPLTVANGDDIRIISNCKNSALIHKEEVFIISGFNTPPSCGGVFYFPTAKQGSLKVSDRGTSELYE
jgi:hypothetical protein